MSRASFKISGKRVPLQAHPPQTGWRFFRRPGGWILGERVLPDGMVENRRFMVSERGTKLGVSIDGWLWNGEVSQSGGAGSDEGVGGDSDLVAQFPGKVRKILVRDGTSVAQGEGLVLIEAMKMEFAVKAPSKGKVLKVLVKEGQQILPGDRFVEFEVADVR